MLLTYSYIFCCCWNLVFEASERGGAGGGGGGGEGVQTMDSEKGVGG